MARRHALPLVLLLIAPLTSLAERHANTVSPQAAEEEGILETTRTQVRGFSLWLGETVNDWFGDLPFEDGGQVTNGRLGLRNLWRQDEGWDTNVRFRARFDLPNLREKAYAFIGRQNEDELMTDQAEAFTREQLLLEERRREDQTGFAGLGLALRRNIDLRAGVRGGLKFYTQARYREQWAVTEQDRIEFRETIFWNTSHKFGSTTALDYEHAFTPTLSLHWQNAATISEKTDGFAWGSSLGLFRRFGDDRLLSGELVATGETGAQEAVGEYGVRMKWTQPVYREWLIGELIVGHYWPQYDEENRERDKSWAVGMNLEMRF